MDYLSTKEAAERWGVSLRYVQRLIQDGRIPGAKKYGGSYLLPADAEKPGDPRRAPKPAAQPHLLPRSCAMLTMSTLYDRPGRADDIVASLASDPNAQALFSAELCYLRGEAARAAFLSRELLLKTACFDTRLGCLLNIANAAMYSGDFSAWEAARDAIARTKALNESEEAARDCCLASVDSSVYDQRGYPSWLRIGCFDPLPPDAFPAARHLYAKLFAISRADVTAIPSLEPLCSQTRAEGAVGAELYLRLVMAAGCHDAGDSGRAAFHISRALDLALPDRLYAPLAEARRNIGVLFDELLRERDLEAYRAVCALWDRLVPAWTSLFEKHMGRALSAELTLRELEAVKYAAAGMSNDEIAARMRLSVNTVRSHLSSAMQKTGLRRWDDFSAYLHLS